MDVALIDPSLFTLPYDVALAGGLTDAGARVTLHGRAPTARDGDTGGLAIEPSYYTVAGSRLASKLPGPARLAIKGVDHLVSALRLRRRLARVPPGIIHFQWLPLPLVDRAILPGFRRIAPVLLTVHDTDPFNGSPTAGLQRAGFARSLSGCDRLIVHTRQGLVRLVALGLPAARISLLPHGPLAHTAEDAEADSMTGELTFVLFGKIKPYKGADLLIEAFASLPPALRALARLRIVGQAYMDIGPLKARVEALGVVERVAIEPRFVADSEMASIFPAGAVAVFPYREIEASGVLSLAMAHGRPIIASRLGNFAETIDDGVQGLLLSPGDIPALTGAMQALLADRALASGMARAARDLAGTLPGWGEIGRLTMGVYEDAVAEWRAPVTRRPGSPARTSAPQEIAS